MNVDSGHIQKVRFIGDYLGLKDVKTIEDRLVNIRFNRSDVDSVLSNYDLKSYFGNITKGEILSLMFE